MNIFEQFATRDNGPKPELAAFAARLTDRYSNLVLDVVLSDQDRKAVSRTIESLGSTNLIEFQWTEDTDFRDDDGMLSESIVIVGDAVFSESEESIGETDSIAEADFYMASGLYDQAVDLINGALEVQPSRRDLLEKACEIYFVWGHKDEFIEAARRLRFVINGDLSGNWEKIAVMGRQIAADHALFAGSASGFSSDIVDLSYDELDESTPIIESSDDLFHEIDESAPRLRSNAKLSTSYRLDFDEHRVAEPKENWSIRFTDDFMKSVSKLDAKLQGRILRALTKIVRNPVKPNGNTTKPLTGDMNGLWRWRIGDFRLVYDPHVEEKAIVLLSVGARGGAYK